MDSTTTQMDNNTTTQIVFDDGKTTRVVANLTKSQTKFFPWLSTASSNEPISLWPFVESLYRQYRKIEQRAAELQEKPEGSAEQAPENIQQEVDQVNQEMELVEDEILEIDEELKTEPTIKSVDELVASLPPVVVPRLGRNPIPEAIENGTMYDYMKIYFDFIPIIESSVEPDQYTYPADNQNLFSAIRKKTDQYDSSLMQWEFEYIKNRSFKDLITLAAISEVLKCSYWLDFACKTIANMSKGKNREQFMALLDDKSNITADQYIPKEYIKTS